MSEEKYEYVVIIPNYWGKATMLHQAVQNCLEQCKTDNHRLNLGPGMIKAFMGKNICMTEMGGISGDDLRTLPDDEARNAWGEGLYDLATSSLSFLDEALSQFKVKVSGTIRVFSEVEEALIPAIYKEFPEDLFQGPATRPPQEPLEIPDYIKEADTETLKVWYLNAKATQSCGGRNKGQRNDELVAKYSQELKDRGEELPEGEGQFNGEGSS